MNTYKPQSNPSDPRSNDPVQMPPAVHANNQLYEETPQKVQPKPKSKNPRLNSLKTSRFKGIFGVAQIAIGAIVAAVIINTFVFQSYEVVGESMLPTLNDGDRLIINKLGKSWSSTFGNDYVPHRGEIIVFNDPSGANRQLVKRVIGLPGDTVDVKNGVITITNSENPQGFNPDESYANSLVLDVNYTLREAVTDDHLFVAGDNRIGGASFDSRNDLGLVPTENVVGDLVLRLLPLANSKFF